MHPSSANAAILEELHAYRERLESEIEQARQLQLMLLPSKGKLKAFESSHLIAVSNFFQPSSTLAGDSWDIWPLDAQRVAFYISDFTGHGVGAAIQSFRLSTLIAHATAHYDNPSALLTHLNLTLKQLLPTEIFCTFFYGILDVQRSELIYASAGAPCPYVYFRHERRCEALQSSGIPLGITASSSYETHHIAFNAGDTLCIYSDALLETPNITAPYLTANRLQEKLARNMQDASNNGQRAFMRALLTKIGALDGVQFADDLTITLITSLAQS